MILLKALAASAAFKASFKLRLKFIIACAQNPQAIRPFFQAAQGSVLNRYLQERPEAFGAIFWPYQCSDWLAQERVRRIATHCEIVGSHLPQLDFPVDDKLILADLKDLCDGITIVLDQPNWLIREGHWALNIFDENFRAFSVAFSMNRRGGIELFIGGLQGRKTENILDLYRQLTKKFHGIRPRDLILELTRMFAVSIGAKRIYAVADEYRYFRHSYFGGQKNGSMILDYDEIWTDRSGIKVAPTHFELPIERQRKEIDLVPTNKRSMYRKRYEMLDIIEKRMMDGVQLARASRFDAI